MSYFVVVVVVVVVFSWGGGGGRGTALSDSVKKCFQFVFVTGGFLIPVVCFLQSLRCCFQH